MERASTPAAGSSVQELTLDAQATVATCSLAGTYLLLQHTTGDLTLVEIDREKQALLLVPVASELQVRVPARPPQRAAVR